MAKPVFNRIASYDSFPLQERLHMRLNLMKKTLKISVFGREATQEEINTALWRYQNTLTEAEEQIEHLQSLLIELDPDIDDSGVEEYLEEYEDLSDKERIQYQIGELKQALFIAMFRQDESNISRFINQIQILEERKEALDV